MLASFSYLLLNLRLDRTMQDIVLKIVPNLYRDEEKRRKEFYESRGLPDRKAHISCKDPDSETSKASDITLRRDFSDFKNSYRDDELVSICLERFGFADTEQAGTSDIEDEKQSEPPLRCSKVLGKKYIRCSVRTMVMHLQRYLRSKLHIQDDQQVQITCNDHIIHPCRTMKFIWISEWLDKVSQAPPIVLQYDIIDR
ncbi:hypothetical protein QZH41_017524 [Actinostola sp. cb2023]|nr:hypothetical protein QZH41_017524 [Actinostola sp. cb2023]